MRIELEFAPPTKEWLEATEMSVQEPFVKVLLGAAERVLGFTPRQGSSLGGTDVVGFQGRSHIPTILAFGAGLLPLAHAPNEYVSVDSIVQASKICALVVLEFDDG